VLTALASQDYAAEYEIIVVDDGSRDATPAVLEEWSRRLTPRLRTFRQENSGPARARNLGARQAKAPFLAFIDDDCFAETSWLRKLEGALQEAGTAAVAGTVVNSEQGWVGRYINRELVINHVPEENGFIAELITANAGLRREVLEELGGFDEAIPVPGGEDTEFSLRLRAAGHRIFGAPEARVFHESRVDLHDYLRMIFHHGRGRRRLGELFPAYRIQLPHLRIFWLLWPMRGWMIRDYRRYRRANVPRVETLGYIVLRYLQNIARISGYIRGI
jgi:GT2 family glycosyltransferase